MIKDKFKIYLFRHGQTTFNRDGRFTGQTEARLTAKGQRHAMKIARELKNKRFEVAIRTRLSRSKDTLKAVLKFHPECKLIMEDNRMIIRRDDAQAIHQPNRKTRLQFNDSRGCY